MPPPLAITRCALLTPLDNPGGDCPTWSAIRAGRHVGRDAAVHDSLLDADTSLDRSIRLALAVGQRVLANTSAEDTALFCGTSKGPVTTFLQALDHLRCGTPVTESQARHVALGVGAMGSILAQRLQLPAGHTSVAACSSGLHALHRAAQALWRGECRRALIVAADASLHPLFEASFARLGVLAPTDAAGIRHCRPFSETGEGFFLTEAAAAILLEVPDSEPSRLKTPDSPLAWLTNSHIAADASALIAVDPTTNSLRHALKKMTSPSPLSPLPSFIHAHATGTGHDLFELAAIRATLGEQVPVFSHKAWLGHSLGAAGLVSLALSIECHRRGELPAGSPIGPDSTSLTIAQGFGGHIAIAALRGSESTQL